MASLSNINGIFDVHSTGAILFSNTHGANGQILKSNGNAAPTWVDPNTVGTGPWLPLAGGAITNNLTIGGTLGVTGAATIGGVLTLQGSGANTTTFDTTAHQLIVKNSAYTDASGMSFRSSNGTFQMQLYGSGSNYGFLGTEWGAWNLRKAQGGGIYLNNQTTYFVQPEGTSNMNAATFAGNVQALTFNGLAINTTGVNNLANQIVRTEVNGYANFGWINTVSGASSGTITRIYASQDAYIRYMTPATFRTQITDPYYAPVSTVSGVTSVATGNGLTGGTITSTGTLTMSGSYTGTFTATDTIQGYGLTSQNKRGNSGKMPQGHYASGETVWEMDNTWSSQQLADYFNQPVSAVYWTEVADAPGGNCIYINGGVYVGGVYGSGFPYLPVETNSSSQADYYMEVWIQNVGTSQSHYMGSNEFDLYPHFGSKMWVQVKFITTHIMTLTCTHILDPNLHIIICLTRRICFYRKIRKSTSINTSYINTTINIYTITPRSICYFCPINSTNRLIKIIC